MSHGHSLQVLKFPFNYKESSIYYFDAEAETPILWLPHAKSWLIGPRPEQPLGRGSALSRLGAELELRRSGSSLGASQDPGVPHFAPKASRKQSSLSGKESAQGCIPKRLLGRPD